MLKRIVNEVQFNLDIKTTGPLLVRSGQASISGPDMTPVRTFRNNEWQVYIPGSSLKGVIRSHSEKITRTLRDGACCDPFAKAKDPNTFCGERLKKSPSPGAAYAGSCAICRLFGSTEFIGRVSIGDAYLSGPSPRKELRDGVGIDRLTGGPSDKAKFELEAVSSGTMFQADVLVRNFECWQLGLLLTVVQDMADGFVRLGGGRSRGFGGVTASVANLSLHQFGAAAGHHPNEVWGMGRFLNDKSYGTDQHDLLTLAAALEWQRRGLRMTASVTGDGVRQVREKGLEALVKRFDNPPVDHGVKQR
jgi:CRISPR-associated RAMP protein (TIGR02581 family)